MQKLKVFSIRDSRAGIFKAPFFQLSMGEAERNFTRLVNDKQSIQNQFPTDFDLYYLGEYLDDTGKFELLPTPQHVIKAVQVHEAPPKFNGGIPFKKAQKRSKN